MELNQGNYITAILRIQMYIGSGFNLFRLVSGLFQKHRQRHGKTGGMGCSNQLLGITAAVVVETAACRIGAFKGTTAKMHGSLAGIKPAAPLGF